MINKITILLLIMIFSIFIANAQNKNLERLISKYGSKEGFSSIQIKEPAKVLPNMNKQNAKELKDLLDGVDVIRLMKMDANKTSKDLSTQFANEVSTFNPSEGFKELLSVKESGGFVKMHIKESSGNVTDLLMIAGDNSDITVIWFNGKLDLEKLQKSAAILPKLLK